MKKFIVTFGAAAVLALAGCASNKIKPISEVKFYPKPTQKEAREKIDAFLSTALIDPYSAKTDCSEVSDEAWVWPGIGYETGYGYLVICQVNAKNRFGAYVGAKRYVFRFNGPEFVYEDVVHKMGLMRKLSSPA